MPINNRIAGMTDDITAWRRDIHENQARPGAFIFHGNGESSPLHHPAYNFNDDAIPHVVSFWAKLAETAMPAR